MIQEACSSLPRFDCVPAARLCILQTELPSRRCVQGGGCAEGSQEHSNRPQGTCSTLMYLRNSSVVAA